MQKVWRGELALCEAAAVAAKAPKESKEDKKAREKARKKERSVARKAEPASDAASGADAPIQSKPRHLPYLGAHADLPFSSLQRSRSLRLVKQRACAVHVRSALSACVSHISCAGVLHDMLMICSA